MQIIQNDVINPSGGEGEYTFVHFKNQAVGIIPIDNEGNTWLVGQFRYAIKSYEWEIPAGGAPHGEAPLDCAKRELAEETGLIANRWDCLIDSMQLSNSITDELAYTYVARELTQAESAPEETESLQVRQLPLSEAIEMVLRGDIHDAFSTSSLLKLHCLLERGEFSL